MTQIELNEEFSSSSGTIAHGAVGNGPDVILVHGTPTSSVVWQGIVTRLHTKYRFHLLDLPGYGQSEMFDGQDVRLRAFARVLAELISFKKLDRPILVGHDFGAATVFGAYLIEKLPVRAICISDGVVLSPWGTPFSRHVRDHEKVFTSVPEYVHVAMLKAHLKTAMAKTPSAAIMKQLVDPWLGDVGQKAYYRQVGQYDYQYTEQLEALYSNITIPTKIFWGQEDMWVDISEGLRLHKMIPRSDFETLPDAGHFAMIDTPGLFAEKLDLWLATILEN